jgi:excisionase family DNA binding protein
MSEISTKSPLHRYLDEGRLIITIEEAAEVMNLKRTSTYDAVRRGDIPSLRLGRRLFVPVHGLMRLLGIEGVSTADTAA